MNSRATANISPKVPLPAPVADMLALSVVEDAAGFDALRCEWTDLFARAADPHQLFQSHVFLAHWARHYLDDDTKLAIVTGRQAGRLVMVWPLVRRTRAGIDMLSFMGAPVAQFGDVLLERNDAGGNWLQQGWRAIESLGADLFEGRRIRSDAALARWDPGKGALYLEQQEAPYADLARRVGEDGPADAYSAKERSNYRRHLRRLSERGTVNFRALLPGDETAEIASEAIALKRDWLKRNGILSPAVSDPRFAGFFQSIAGDSAHGSPLRVTLIECDGKRAGIDLSFDCKGRTFGHVIATDAAYEREGVGTLLVHQVFAQARCRGNTIFDLLAPADRYKLQHADGSIPVEDIVVPFTLRGRLYARLVLKGAKPLARRVNRMMPRWVLRIFSPRMGF